MPIERLPIRKFLANGVIAEKAVYIPVVTPAPWHVQCRVVDHPRCEMMQTTDLLEQGPDRLQRPHLKRRRIVKLSRADVQRSTKHGVDGDYLRRLSSSRKSSLQKSASLIEASANRVRHGRLVSQAIGTMCVSPPAGLSLLGIRKVEALRNRLGYAQKLLLALSRAGVSVSDYQDVDVL